MKNRTYISLVASLFLLGACSLDPKNIGTPDDAGDEGASDDTGTTGTSGGTIDPLGVTESSSDAQTTDSTSLATDSTSLATDSDTEPGSTTDTPVAGCECADACTAYLCPVVEWIGSIEGGLDADAADALEVAMTCALTALRDGKAGRISWHSNIGSGEFDERGRFDLLGDGTARRSYDGTKDQCTYSETVTFGNMKSAEFFSDCLAEPDPEARFLCVRSAGAGTISACGEPGVEECEF